MKVEKISANIRYSQDTGKGAWKVIELGAEATVSDREHWKQAQSELYYQLAGQLQTLWSNGSNNSNGAALNGAGGAETAIQPLSEPAPVSGSETQTEHWCEEHQMAHTQKHGKDESTWYSHKAPDGSWWREPAGS